MFTKDEIKKIQDMTKGNSTQREIADYLGIPLATLRHRLGQSGYKFDVERVLVPITPVAIATSGEDTLTNTTPAKG